MQNPDTFDSKDPRYGSNSLAYDSNVVTESFTEVVKTPQTKEDNLSSIKSQTQFSQQEFRRFLKELQVENDLMAQGLCQSNAKNPSYIRALYYKKLCN